MISESGGQVASHIDSGFPPQPAAAGRLAVETAIKYLQGEPVAEVMHPAVVLPPELEDGIVLLPPTGDDQIKAKLNLEAAMAESGIEVEEFNTDLVVIYPEGSPEEAKFYAAPLRSEFDEFQEGVIGVLWDVNGEFGNGSLVYKVRFIVSDKIGELFNEQAGISIQHDAFFARQDKLYKPTIAFFVESSCYGCWAKDESVCCLICIPD
jgi:hypothetical protein